MAESIETKPYIYQTILTFRFVLGHPMMAANVVYTSKEIKTSASFFPGSLILKKISLI